MAKSRVEELQSAARAVGREIEILNAGSESEIDSAFATLVQLRAGALFVSADGFFTFHRHQLVALAARHAVPASYFYRRFTEAGGLMSYGADLSDTYRQVGVYAGRILKGAKPADLPVLQPTKFELVINLKTAKALGLQIPDKLLALAAAFRSVGCVFYKYWVSELEATSYIAVEGGIG